MWKDNYELLLGLFLSTNRQLNWFLKYEMNIPKYVMKQTIQYTIIINYEMDFISPSLSYPEFHVFLPPVEKQRN